MRILDAHHHFWDLHDGRYPWLSDHIEPDFFLGDYSALRGRDFLPADYREATAGFDVVGTVHVEAERDRADQIGETHWLQHLHATTGLPSAIVAHAWFDRPETAGRLAAHARCALVRGIRSKPVTAASAQQRTPGAPGTMQDDRWLRGYALLARHGFSWDLRVPPWHLAEAAEVAQAFPHIPVALNHTGFPWDRSEDGLRQWRHGMERLARCDNVVVKISELGLRDARWTIGSNRRVVREAIEIFGIGRSLFASNWPVCTLRLSFADLVHGLHAMLPGLDDDALDRFFCRNAARFYRIGLEGG